MEQVLSRSAHKKAEYRRQTVFTWLFILFQVAAILGVLFAFVLSPVRVNGSSMGPTLQAGEILLVDKLTLFLRTPERGSMVVFHHENMEGELIKRIIAMPGETVQIKEGNVYINGYLLDESMYQPDTAEDYGAIQVPEGCVFVLGDDRRQSFDSRDPSIGFIPVEQLDGRVRLRVSPFSKITLFL